MDHKAQGTNQPAAQAAANPAADRAAGIMTARERIAWDRVVAGAGSTLPPPRLLVVLAHPDDEVLALGARLERLSAARLVTLTDGAPQNGADASHHGFASLEAYRTARRAEIAAALAHAGLSPSIASPFPALPPVPDQTAAMHLEVLTRGLVAVLAEFSPEAVLTHPYEGGHPDHDACAFAVHTAMRLRRLQSVGDAGSEPQPLLLEAPFYHRDRHWDGNGGMRTGKFLDADRFPALELQLSPSERTNKKVRLACFPTQSETLGQFSVEYEAFRPAPDYDFSRPPHQGELLYEGFPWGMTGDQFRTLACDAQRHLLGEAFALHPESPSSTENIR